MVAGAGDAGRKQEHRSDASLHGGGSDLGGDSTSGGSGGSGVGGGHIAIHSFMPHCKSHIQLRTS